MEDNKESAARIAWRGLDRVCVDHGCFVDTTRPVQWKRGGSGSDGNRDKTRSREDSPTGAPNVHVSHPN